MRKSTSRLLYLSYWGLGILGCFVFLGPIFADPAVPTEWPLPPIVVGIEVLGILLMLLGIICFYSAWIVAFIRTFHLKRWGWFFSLFLPGIPLLCYIFGGPDFYSSKVAQTEIKKKSITSPFCRPPHVVPKINTLEDEGILEHRHRPGFWQYGHPSNPPVWYPPSVEEFEVLSPRAKNWRSLRPTFAIFTKWNQLYYCEQCNIVFNPATHEQADLQHIHKLL